MSDRMTRKDIMGVEVEVGDICLSAPKHKWSSKPYVGKVTNVSDTGRVTLKHPAERNIYAYERGAPDKEQESYRWVPDLDEPLDRWGLRPHKREPYKYMQKDYTVVGTEWYWEKRQGADINLFVLRKGGQDVKSIEDILATNLLFKAIDLDYDTERPAISTEPDNDENIQLEEELDDETPEEGDE